MTVFTTLRAANIARDKLWDPEGKITLSFRGNELAGELGETCNLLKKMERERMGLVGSRASVEQLTEELADIAICIDLIAMEFDIDLGRAVIEKFNKTSRARNLPVEIEEPSS